MVFRQTIDIGRVIQKAFAFGLNQARIVLTYALQALPPNSGGMGFPVRSRQLAEPVGAHGDATIYDGDQMGVGNQIQNIPTPWPVNTRKENIAVERRAETFLLIHRSDNGLDPEGSAVARAAKCRACTSTLSRPMSARVA